MLLHSQKKKKRTKHIYKMCEFILEEYSFDLNEKSHFREWYVNEPSAVAQVKSIISGLS